MLISGLHGDAFPRPDVPGSGRDWRPSGGSSPGAWARPVPATITRKPSRPPTRWPPRRPRRRTTTTRAIQTFLKDWKQATSEAPSKITPTLATTATPPAAQTLLPTTPTVANQGIGQPVICPTPPSATVPPASMLPPSTTTPAAQDLLNPPAALINPTPAPEPSTILSALALIGAVAWRPRSAGPDLPEPPARPSGGIGEEPGRFREAGRMPDLDRPSPPAHPWDGYLIGPENALAHAGAMALARGETAGFSPLVVHGPAGSGKSRLLAGLVAERLLAAAGVGGGARWRRRRSRRPAPRPRGGRGAGRRSASGSGGSTCSCSTTCTSLERAPWAMDELSHTLDALDEAGAAVAVAARSGPGQWSGWPSRLVNRLVGGLSVRLDPPSVESRRRYLLERARGRGGWPCRPRSSSRWPRRPTATGRSTAGSRSWA